RQRTRIIIGVLVALQLGEKALVVPHVEAVELAEDVHVARHRRRLSQSHGDEHASLHVELTGLPEIVDAIEVSRPSWMRRRHPTELLLNLQPYGHWIHPNELARQTGDEQLTSVLGLHKRAEGIGHLESAFVIDARRCVASKHTSPRPC